MEKLNLKQKLELKKLRDHNVAKVEVNYSGGGDDGMIDDMDFYDMDGNNIDNINIDDCLEEYFYSYICRHVQWDWINNDGGYGALTIDLTTNELDINHTQRHSEYYHYSPDKTKILEAINGTS